ncbi:MAG: leukotriene-A4 hydrolase, partial [Bacteroidia bacterium]
GDSALYAAIDPSVWAYGPGLPSNVKMPESSELDRVEVQIQRFKKGASTAPELDTSAWTAHHWLYFLRGLGVLNVQQVTDLDQTFKLSNSGNSEILCDWFQKCIPVNYQPAYPNMKEFLVRVGRRKFLTPIYSELIKTTEGRAWAKDVFAIAKKGYHSVSINSIEELFAEAKKG